MNNNLNIGTDCSKLINETANVIYFSKESWIGMLHNYLPCVNFGAEESFNF